MSQAMKVAWESAAAITTDHINASGGIPVDRKEIRDFLASFPEAVTASIAMLNPAATECKVAAVNIVSKSWDEPSRNLDCFASESKRFHVWLSGDRDMHRLFCELAYGGAGKITPVQSAELPLAKVDQRLTRHILRIVSENLATSVAEQCESSFQRVEDPDPESLEKFAAPQRLVEVKLTVEALRYRGEIIAYFVADEMNGLLLESAPALQSLSPFNSVKKCKFELLSLLPPDEVPLSVVLALKPGSQLSLSISVETPIMVVCGGETVFEGECDPSGDQINIHLRARGESGPAQRGDSLAAA